MQVANQEQPENISTINPLHIWSWPFNVLVQIHLVFLHFISSHIAKHSVTCTIHDLVHVDDTRQLTKHIQVLFKGIISLVGS